MTEALQLIKELLFLRPALAMEFAMFWHTIKGAMHVRAQGEQYWLTAIISVVFACFSGGTIAPILIGRVAGPLANDLIVPFAVVAWYITHHFGGFFYNILKQTPFKLAYGLLSDTFRAIGIFKQVDLALSIIPASNFYPVPVFGPILLGTVAGCFALFMPLDKGLSSLKFGTPVPIQTAFFMSATYHFMTNDTGFIGTLLRSVLGTYDRETVQLALILFGICFGIITTLFGPHANPFTPFHKFFYLVFQAHGPENPNKDKPGTVGWDLGRRHLLRRLLDVGRAVAVIAGILAHYYIISPPTSLAAGASLVPGGRIGVCQFLAPYRNCVPYSFAVENDGSLYVYYGTNGERGTSQIMWQQKPETPAKEGDKVNMEFGKDGILRVFANDQLLQQYPATAEAVAVDAVPELHINEITGKPYVAVGGNVQWKA